MEKVLTVDDIGYFRSLAEAKVPESELPGIKSQSWFAGWWGSDPDKDVKELENEFGLTDAERNMFYQAIGYNENEAAEISLSTTPKEVNELLITINMF